jgi:methyltransferase (TIGR00027 family)
MDTEQYSRTALATAASRAAHLIVDGEPSIFADVLALPLLGKRASKFVGHHEAAAGHPALAGTRSLATVRSRYTEDRLAESAQRGVTQYVILGAGLDSFGYRSSLAGQVRVFEVDHPATQEWKRRRLAAADIAVPDAVTFVPVDFETGGLLDSLTAGGLDLSEPAVVSWLGVIMYLTRPAIGQTLAQLAKLAPGSELIVNYMLPASLRDSDASAYADIVMPVSAERGEPWLTFLTPAEMTALLASHGFAQVDHVSQRDAVDAALWQRSDSLRPLNLSNIAHAVLG